MQTLETPTFPQQLFNLRSGDSALFVHAHPDDETVFTGAAIAALVAQNIRVYTATATDGERSTKGDAAFVRRGGRRLESMAAQAILGVAAERRHYFGLPDSRLATSAVEVGLALDIARTSYRQRIRTVIVPDEAGVDGNADHRAVHRAALLAGRLLSTTGYFVDIWEHAGKHEADLSISVDPVHKAKAVAAHASQFSGQHAADLQGYTGLMTDSEPYRRVTNNRLY